MKRHTAASVLLMIAAVACLINVPSTVMGHQDPTNYYAVHVASFRTISGVYALIESLKKEGCQPFYVNADIPGKGMWYRVFACFCENRDDAIARADNMKNEGIIGEYAILEIEKNLIPGKSERLTKRDDPGEQAKHEETYENRTSDLSGSAAGPIEQEISQQKDPSKSNEKQKNEVSVKNEAEKEYESGQYESALTQYRDMLKRKNLTQDQKETAARRIADCYFQIGTKGKRDALFQAIEHYRILINTYSGNATATAFARLRLAQCYDHITMYYEAIRELRNLMAKHPDSSSYGDAIHLLGTIYYKQKKYGEAAKKFENYIKRYADAADSETIYFTIGDCYSLMNEYQKADQWYRDALKRWPDIENLSKNDLMRLGMHYSRSSRYKAAIRTLFVYLNLYPDREESRKVMLTIAKAYIGDGEISLGLKLLSLVTERYQETDEARESSVTMANLGVTHPGIKLPRYILSGIDRYDHPIETYNQTAVTSPDRTVKEEVMFQRGIALAKTKRYEEAFDAFDYVLQRFKPGRKTKESRKQLVNIGKTLVDRWFEHKDYVAVADLYFRVRRKGLFEYADFSMLFKIGTSLREIGLYHDARRILEEMKGKRISDHEREQVMLALAKVYFDAKQYDKAENETQLIINNRNLSDQLSLQQAREIMGDICYQKEMYRNAARFYSKIISSGVSRDTMKQVYKKYADALKNGGLFPSALVNYKRALSNDSNGGNDNRNVRIGSLVGVGECYFHEGHYEKSIDMFKRSLDQPSAGNSNLWNLYWMGRGYLNLEDKAEANQVFESLKEKGQDEFWTALVDYCIEDKFWCDLYRRYKRN